MKILVVGSGGREHSIAWKLSRSGYVKKIFCAPGNPGISSVAECVGIQADDIEGLKAFASENRIDLTVVGPELPLTLGIADLFKTEGLKLFGPSGRAAKIEGSKLFAKRIMKKYGIPTASYRSFDNASEAKAYVEAHHPPLVIKADGLAAGKGALICNTMDETFLAIELLMEKKVFGDAGSTVVIEEFLSGRELSMLVVTDGESVLPLASAQDHKAALDGDRGPNTGGMGAYSPARLSVRLQNRIMSDIIVPTIRGLKQEGALFKGVLYAGIILTKDGPKVLEFNCRFGDPETQPVLMRLKSDLLSIFLAAVDGTLSEVSVEWDRRSAVCVVLASEGYPDEYEKGKIICGIDSAEAMKGVKVFHAGTEIKDNRVVTAGGRVLGVTGIGLGVSRAIRRAYMAVEEITWDGVYYRTDIGLKAIGVK